MYTIYTKGINKDIVDDELRYEDYKNVLFNRSYMRHEMNRIQSKAHNIGSYKFNKFPCLLTMINNIYFKMDIANYYIFINLLVNHIKNNFVEYRQFVLTFALVRTAILFSLFSVP